MAQGYRCDWPDHDAPADFLITALGNGDVDAYCGPHYIETIRGALAALDAASAEADATAAAATAALEQAPTPLAGRRPRGAPRDEPAGESAPGEDAEAVAAVPDEVAP